MNKQGVNGIEWCNYTWNPVTGCYHGCKYCYAHKIANRFDAGYVRGNEDNTFVLSDKAAEYIVNPETHNGHTLIAQHKPIFKNTGILDTQNKRHAAYPFGFCPTFHAKRLDEPQKVKKPSRIFVVSMGDLFGEWVPDEWIMQVYFACQKADHHKYLFLTKNPKRYSVIYRTFLDYRYNMWFGATVTNEDEFDSRGFKLFNSTGIEGARHGNRFLSIEPLLGSIGGVVLQNLSQINWVIIGQQTNPNIPPKDEWVQNIIDQCRDANVPVFVKSPLYKRFPIQEWPESLKTISEVSPCLN